MDRSQDLNPLNPTLNTRYTNKRLYNRYSRIRLILSAKTVIILAPPSLYLRLENYPSENIISIRLRLTTST
jgi:hypothetical protein